jgi:hypothetical protein
LMPRLKVKSKKKKSVPSFAFLCLSFKTLFSLSSKSTKSRFHILHRWQSTPDLLSMTYFHNFSFKLFGFWKKDNLHKKERYLGIFLTYVVNLRLPKGYFRGNNSLQNNNL